MRRLSSLHLGAAASASAVLDRQREDLVSSGIDDLLDLGPVGLERFVHSAHVALHTVVAAVVLIHAYPPRLRIRVEPDVSVISGEDGFVVARHPGVVDAAHDLQVLLRHRYSDRPTASRTCSGSRKARKRSTFPFRNLNIQPAGDSVSTPLVLPR